MDVRSEIMTIELNKDEELKVYTVFIEDENDESTYSMIEKLNKEVR